MNNIKHKTKIILFVSLIVAIVLPFTSMEMIDAIPTEKTDKKEKREQVKGNGYIKKDLTNYKAEKIMIKLMPLLITSMPQEPISEKDQNKIEELQKQLDKAIKNHQKKIIDKELRKEIKKAHKLISQSDIPIKTIVAGIDHLYIQLPIEMSDVDSAKYEAQVAKLFKDGVPYLLEYGEGFKRGACVSTESDCNYEIGGIKIQIPSGPNSVTECSLSVPMMKNGVDGFLTAAHCFNGYSELVYQPDASQEETLIGHSDPSWRSFEAEGECDCAWIKDTSSTQQRPGVYAFPNAYFPQFQTHNPSVGEYAMFRGFHSSNNEEIFYWADKIDGDIVTIDDGFDTMNAMSFKSPFEAGDSGGAVFYGNSYIGIAVASGYIDGEFHTVFIPWHHVTENISGLELKPHP